MREPGSISGFCGDQNISSDRRGRRHNRRADISSVNRAEEVTDGQKIVIYSKEDISQEGEVSESYGQTAEDKVNINKADSSKLQTVPGIGPATAQKIIEYREKKRTVFFCR